jgi:putative ABC transport system permease protein
MREIFPHAKRIGMLWNPAEANSEICTNMAREAAKKYGFVLKERIVTNTNEIEEALKAVIADGIDIFFTSGDVTVSMAVPSIAASLLRKGIPYFTNTPADIKDNVFICLGADYFEVGEEAAKVLERVIKGEKTDQIPIEMFVPENLSINLKIAKELNITIPEKVVLQASKVVR